ncbi:hypothetical protein I317_04059 [Kwoniella heveanensis CBS 569]|uniref:Uncharacterized protein n=1 Tax=Kwoniella heveanensis BCC8398 TaxID=1296120 RepID=A0A1B9H3A5_9TREE|nr:hypothetical protein I316_00864 [Kwoniella heveanensis BCC8398]OCF42088.1 hypothetical protein I317_04059 [Kwoniella heveanensis CBS 569]
MNPSHPFFVNQTPYLRDAVASSSKHTRTIYSPFSVYTQPESSSHMRTKSTTSVNTLASETSFASTTSSSSTSSLSRATPIDRECLRWMQRETHEDDHIFGSVACRGRSMSIEEREVKRRAMEEDEGTQQYQAGREAEAEAETEAKEAAKRKTIKAERRKGRIGKFF